MQGELRKEVPRLTQQSHPSPRLIQGESSPISRGGWQNGAVGYMHPTLANACNSEKEGRNDVRSPPPIPLNSFMQIESCRDRSSEMEQFMQSVLRRFLKQPKEKEMLFFFFWGCLFCWFQLCPAAAIGKKSFSTQKVPDFESARTLTAHGSQGNEGFTPGGAQLWRELLRGQGTQTVRSALFDNGT